jgi:hypothetical protein
MCDASQRRVKQVNEEQKDWRVPLAKIVHGQKSFVITQFLSYFFLEKLAQTCFWHK